MPQKNALKKFSFFMMLIIATFNHANAAYNDSIVTMLKNFINQAITFSERMPREKVSVHLDNTGYFHGDEIWFQCYVVDGLKNAPTQLSRTLYAELLNPRGNIIATQILKIENGRCHGAFKLDHLPFYSGFYEIRAYTKYMLNFGDAAVFSRVIPVFDKPKIAGDYTKRKMAGNISQYPGPRRNTNKAAKVSMRFFPEGGKLIAGFPSKVAFEITGRNGMPLEGNGRVIDELTGETVATIQTLHEGRGFFEITPESHGKYKAVITYGNENNEYSCKLPQARLQGIGLSVDNLSNPDSILVTIRATKGIQDTDVAGLVISSRGALWSYALVNLTDKQTLKFNSKKMPTGVSVISVFGHDGRTLAERMIFVDNGGYGTLATAFDKARYAPLEKVKLDITATDATGNPAARLPLSVSVTDGDNAVDFQGGLLADLLLMSEIKGYVRNPMQYFHPETEHPGRNLDLLMMVQGWRCYSWEEMSDVKPIRLRFYPEYAIDVDGKVVSFVRSIPKANADISLMISRRDVPDSLRQCFTDLLTTDSCGRFHLSYDLNSKWDLLMSVSENGKNKDYRMILDRLFSPTARKYELAEMTVDNFRANNTDIVTQANDIDSINEKEETDRILKHIDDSLAAKTVRLNEIVVKGKRNREADIYEARSNSVVYYDMKEELGNLTDKGEVIGQDLFGMLQKINPNFQKQYIGNKEKIFYHTKEPLFVIDYETTYERDSLNYTNLYLESIKSIFISESPSIMVKYADPAKYTALNIDDKYSCAVFIETFPDGKGPARKGTRLQTIEGYTIPKEFQNIDDVNLLDNPDLRRTLYWNPLLTTDTDGKATIEFFKNSTCRNMRISIQGIDGDGTIFFH